MMGGMMGDYDFEVGAEAGGVDVPPEPVEPPESEVPDPVDGAGFFSAGVEAAGSFLGFVSFLSLRA